jgi:hypothetical protein
MAEATRALQREHEQRAATLRLQPLDRLVGRWSSEATRPALPGVVVPGTLTAEWLEGGHFLIIRTRNDHPDMPDAVSIIGITDVDRGGDPLDAATDDGSQLSLHYFDSRGFCRVYDALVDADSWRLFRNAPGLSQTFVGEFTDDGAAVLGLWRLCEDGAHWRDDLRVVYRRR